MTITITAKQYADYVTKSNALVAYLAELATQRKARESLERKATKAAKRRLDALREARRLYRAS